jgi:hypothetical protein
MAQVYTTVCFNGNAELPFPRDLLEALPGFPGKPLDKSIDFTTDYDVSFKHLSTVLKVLHGKDAVFPLIDLMSHLDVYIVLKICKLFGIGQEAIAKSFAEWTDNRKWLDLRLPEYIYLIFLEMEELANIRKFIRYGRNIFETIARTAKLTEIKSNPVMYIDFLMFFKNYKFQVCFDENNPKVQAKLEQLEKERESAWELFMINPHTPSMDGYFNHVPCTSDAWKCDGISVLKQLEVGHPTLATKEVAKERFEIFTHGVFNKPLNKKVTTPFPFESVIFAGGATAKFLGVDYDPKNARQSDVDIFIIGKTFDERNTSFKRVLSWFETYTPGKRSNVFYATRGSVTTIYIRGIQRKYQIISSNSSNIFETIGRFDLTHIQWGMFGGQFYGTPEAMIAMREKLTRFSNTRRLKAYRMVKAMHCGYDVLKTRDIVENFIDITPLIEDPENLQLKKMIREFYGFYYPTANDMDDAEDLQHILCMIEKDANATLVTDDPSYVLNTVTISGNFETDYESILFTSFNAGTIMNKAQGRQVTKLLIRSRHSAIRLTTDMLKITHMVTNDTGIDVTLHSPGEEFKNFCEQLEGPVYRMFRAGGVTHHIMNDKHEITLNIPRYILENQTKRGTSIMRNQRGAALNIEEDMHVGDEIQIMFLIEVVMLPEERKVGLKPLKFIKYEKYDPAAIAVAYEVEEDLNKEITRMAAQTEFEGSITYEDN